MPLFLFNVENGRLSRDTEGTEMPDAWTARAECLKMAGQIIADAGAANSSRRVWLFEVTDEAGRPVWRMAFTAEMVCPPER